MVTFVANDGSSVDLHPSLMDAVERNAKLQAELTAALLDQLRDQFCRQGHEFPSAGFPAAFLLELGALGQLKLWELQGLRPYLPAMVPTSDQASTNLLRRVETDPLQFNSVKSATLGRTVMQVWLDHFSWDAPLLLQAEVIIGEVDEDSLVDALVPLLWAYRHKIRDGEVKLSETA